MDRALIDEAARALSVRAVLLRSSRVHADDALLPPADQDLSVVAQYRAGPAGVFEIVEIEEDDGKAVLVIFHFTTGVRLLDQTALAAIKGKKKAKAGTESIRLEILAEFSAHYRLRAGADADALRPALEEFGRCNVGLHVWPYWREYVQNTCARMGIPIIPIGMYSLPKAPESQASDG